MPHPGLIGLNVLCIVVELAVEVLREGQFLDGFTDMVSRGSPRREACIRHGGG